MKVSASGQRGSAILYIFIGVALFGALMFFFARGSQDGTKVHSDAEISLAVSEIVEYGQTVQTSVHKLMQNGCSENDLRFYYADFYSDTDYEGQADFNNSAANQCFVFSGDSGKVKWKRPPKLILDQGYTGYDLDYVFSGTLGVEDIGGNSCPETELMMLVRVPKDVCMAYNDKFGIPNTGGTPPKQQFSSPSANYVRFGWGPGTPGFGCGMTIGTGTPAATELIGKEAGCYEANSPSTDYYAYYVLLGR